MKKSETKRKPTNDFDKKYDATKYRGYIPDIKFTAADGETERAEIAERRLVPIPEPTINNVKVSAPATFKDVKQLVLALARHEAVIVDVSRIHPDCVERVLDYMSGAVFALGGTEKSVNKSIYMFTPKVNAPNSDE